jgi:hypothetical protein
LPDDATDDQSAVARTASRCSTRCVTVVRTRFGSSPRVSQTFTNEKNHARSLERIQSAALRWQSAARVLRGGVLYGELDRVGQDREHEMKVRDIASLDGSISGPRCPPLMLRVCSPVAF